MPEREDDLTPPPNLEAFAQQLKQLTPQHVQLSRDALLFAAGQAAAAPKTSPWLWPSLTGLFAAICLVLTGFLITPSPTPLIQYVDRERIVYVERSEAEAPAVVVAPPLSTQEMISHEDEESQQLAEQLRLRREVLRWGVDMLPKATPPRVRPKTVSDGELAQWLNVPLGMFSTHRPITPKKTSPKPPEDE